ncbi:hypothetical protein ACJ72_02846 [Emergomyces africanus]|uniref:Uncharacterized protein n=1 Tax=Emergomyces africanus TaxID=1955775 RepID=A0A1B7P1A7_9EURO|nr:hypothetical protein ACJ72_02846 [Emergomyces africanus]
MENVRKCDVDVVEFVEKINLLVNHKINNNHRGLIILKLINLIHVYCVVGLLFAEGKLSQSSIIYKILIMIHGQNDDVNDWDFDRFVKSDNQVTDIDDIDNISS